MFRFSLKYKVVMTDVAADNVTVRSDYTIVMHCVCYKIHWQYRGYFE